MGDKVLRVLLVLPLLAGFLLHPAVVTAQSEPGVPPSDGEPDPRLVIKVVDGDTLILGNGDRIRLIGVDTPELVDENGRNAKNARRTERDVKTIEAYAAKARDYVKKAFEGKRVRLEYEPANAVTRHRDAYGRILAYVYRESDDLFLNAELIKEGYGFSFTYFPCKYREDFQKLEKKARERRRGLWG